MYVMGDHAVASQGRGDMVSCHNRIREKINNKIYTDYFLTSHPRNGEIKNLCFIIGLVIQWRNNLKVRSGSFTPNNCHKNEASVILLVIHPMSAETKFSSFILRVVIQWQEKSESKIRKYYLKQFLQERCDCDPIGN